MAVFEQDALKWEHEGCLLDLVLACVGILKQKLCLSTSGILALIP